MLWVAENMWKMSLEDWDWKSIYFLQKIFESFPNGKCYVPAQYHNHWYTSVVDKFLLKKLIFISLPDSWRHLIQVCTITLCNVINSVWRGNSKNDRIKYQGNFKIGEIFIGLSKAEYWEFVRDILHNFLLQLQNLLSKILSNNLCALVCFPAGIWMSTAVSSHCGVAMCGNIYTQAGSCPAPVATSKCSAVQCGKASLTSCHHNAWAGPGPV